LTTIARRPQLCINFINFILQIAEGAVQFNNFYKKIAEIFYNYRTFAAIKLNK